MSDSHAQILVVDSSKVARRMIERALKQALADVEVVTAASGAEALASMENFRIDLITTSLLLKDMDGLEFSSTVRKSFGQRYIPIIVVSGETETRLERRQLGDDVTDYFDKRHGYAALSQFVEAYVVPSRSVSGRVLYVEDSRVVAMATRRVLEAAGLSVEHTVTVEAALELIKESLAATDQPGADIILTDVYLKGGLTGKDLLHAVRTELDLNRKQMPVLVMTGDDNRKNQRELFEAGANDLVEKPIEEQLLINKLRFQLKLKGGDTA